MTPLRLQEFTEHFKNLHNKLVDMLWHHYESQSPLQSAFCALILQVEPYCKIRRLYDALPYRSQWMNMVEFENSFANLGYSYKSMPTKATEIDVRLLPCLYISESDKSEYPQKPYIILEIDNDNQSLSVFDCVQDKAIVINFSEAEKWGLGKAGFFKHLEEEKQVTSKFIRAGTGYSWFRALVSRFNGVFYQVMFVGFFLNILSFATPVFIILIYDRVISLGAINTLVYLVAGISLIIIFEWCLRYLRGQSLSWLAARLGTLVGNTIFSHLLKLSPDHIERASASSQISRIRSFEYVRDFFSGPIFLSMLELPFIFITLAVIGFIAGALVWVPIIMSVLYLALFIVMRRYIRVLIRSAAKASSIKQNFTMEALEKVEAIRTYGLEKAWSEKFRQLSGREYCAHFKLDQFGMTSEVLANGLTILSAVAVLGFGTLKVWEGQMSVGALVATMILVWRVLTPLYSLCSMIPRLEQLENSVRQINELMDIDNETLESKRKVKLKRIRGRLTFQNVSLQYDEDKDPVFQELTFNAPMGSFTAISGSSGGGKTGVLKLVQGMYKPKQGSIRLDRLDIRQLDLIDMRRQIAYVPQQPDFFYGTIAENLQFAKPTATEDEMWAALRLSCAEETVKAMPQKLKTVIAKPGSNDLMPYFKFQLSLARMYLQNATLVLIDEQPNVILNKKAGGKLKNYIEKSKGKRTILMVTTRKDFLTLADGVVVLKPHQHHSNEQKQEDNQQTEKRYEFI